MDPEERRKKARERKQKQRQSESSHQTLEKRGRERDRKRQRRKRKENDQACERRGRERESKRQRRKEERLSQHDVWQTRDHYQYSNLGVPLPPPPNTPLLKNVEDRLSTQCPRTVVKLFAESSGLYYDNEPEDFELSIDYTLKLLKEYNEKIGSQAEILSCAVCGIRTWMVAMTTSQGGGQQMLFSEIPNLHLLEVERVFFFCIF